MSNRHSGAVPQGTSPESDSGLNSLAIMKRFNL
jgi:hypothetical protein